MWHTKYSVLLLLLLQVECGVRGMGGQWSGGGGVLKCMGVSRE